MEHKYDVFISYSSKDQKIVEGMCHYLEERNLRCFVAYRDVPKGGYWGKYISPAIKKSKVFIYVHTSTANESEDTTREIVLALKCKLIVIPFRAEDIEYSDDKEYNLTNLNWLDAFPEEPESYFGDLYDIVKVNFPEREIKNKDDKSNEATVESESIKCPHCNGEHSVTATFCEETGKKLKKACTNNSCTEYGKNVLPPQAKFCFFCGSPIIEETDIISQLQKEVERLKKELDSCLLEKRDLNKILVEIKKALEIAEKGRNEDQQCFTKLENKHKEEISQLKKELSSRLSEVNDLNAIISEKEEKQKAIERELKQIETKRKEEEQNFLTQEKKLKEEVSKLKQELSSSLAEIQKLRRTFEYETQSRAEQERKNQGLFTANGVTFKMVAVQGGTYTMGATSEQGSDAWDTEKPAHKETVSDFMIGETPVTQELWQAVMGSNPSNFTGDIQRPVERVSWDDCQTFIRKLNQLTGENFRLPTEAEWEYAARGGNKSRGYKYSGSNNVGTVAWYYYNSGNTTHRVKTKQPNELGIYDMSGNVWEWCQDKYSSDYNSPRNSGNRVLRGGCWRGSAWDVRVSNRGGNPGYRNFSYGLRLAF